MTKRIHLRKGLDLPIAGAPAQSIRDGPTINHVALVGDDYVGMKPTMEVSEGDQVRLGQLLFTDKKTPGVRYTAPGAGKVLAINRGAKRKFESLVIELDGDEDESFETLADHNLAQLERGRVCEHMIATGLWTSLRQRPYGKVPDPASIPAALFVTAIDTNPLAADPAVVLKGQERDFAAGLQALSTLPDGSTFLCIAQGADIPGTDEKCVTIAEFSGPHPAGLPGTHIHFLSPVSESRTAWHVNYQDVVAIGHSFLTGRLSVDRVLSVAGPAAAEPCLLRTRLGAKLSELTTRMVQQNAKNGAPNDVRTVSGCVLSGRLGSPPHDYLGRYHWQIGLLYEGRQREFLGWMMPGQEKFSVKRVFTSAIASNSNSRIAFTTSTGGSPRAIVPIGSYEQVMPLDIIATPLLKALVTEDTQYAQKLGCLELDEEDLALCTFVCPGKYNYGPILRRNLQRIEQEG